MRRTHGLAAIGALALVFLAACSSDEPVATVEGEPATGSRATVEVYASPDCGCCHQYIPYLEQNGFAVETVSVTDVNAVKLDLGVPEDAWSCHTAVAEGYVIEGHVPVEAIDKLLAERPAIDGIALPGMPSGAPGMEGAKTAPFVVVAIDGKKLEPFMTI